MWRKWTRTMEMTQKQTFFDGAYSNLTPNLFYQKFLKYFNDFQNRNFSVLLLKWTQIVKMKQNQTFAHGAYSNLTPNHFLSKNIEVFQWLSKLKFLSFMTKDNPSDRNETKSDIFSVGHIQISNHFSLVTKK